LTKITYKEGANRRIAPQAEWNLDAGETIFAAVPPAVLATSGAI